MRTLIQTLTVFLFIIIASCNEKSPSSNIETGNSQENEVQLDTSSVLGESNVQVDSAGNSTETETKGFNQ